MNTTTYSSLTPPKMPPPRLPSIIPMIGGIRLLRAGLTVRPISDTEYTRQPDGSIRRRDPKPWHGKSERRRVLKMRQNERNNRTLNVGPSALAV